MNNYRPSPFANISPVVKNLLIINGIFFLATMLFKSNPSIPIVQYLAVYYFDSPFFKVWQVVSYMFMHGGFAHIMFNMFALYSFGSVLEYMIGSKRFLNFYLITGLGALALQYFVQAIELYNITGSITNNGSFMIDTITGGFSYNTQLLTESQAATIANIYLTPMVGASGAIFGVLAAFGLLFPNAELMVFLIPVPVKAKYLIPVYIVIELFLGVAQFSGDSVAHFAHLGGALFGFILIKIWKIRRPGGFI
ncbi:rhomboid family intramembrane serine protease [Arcticibacter tournemirensis]|uniref:Rhomboid family intramembrane serine protease n=1 Tax=Arcticibacter tournemirensis TaxID=699437 RepID=A0A4V1KHP3_9SPHI|nr:rhomboid family intramembrane serine protease [Arcticibacter tournemirensis]RXF67892.1 rhomboid family intramembrane serine protease [Arcticibacter tournemirensis]